MARASGTERADRSNFATHQGVATSHRGECLIEAGPGAFGAGQPVVEIDPVGVYPELGQALALGGEVLLVGGAARVATRVPNMIVSVTLSHL